MDIRVEKRKIKLVFLILFFGMILPVFLTHQNFKIYDSIDMALDMWDKE